MARGAVGQCVQKVAEAEVLAWGGIPDILVRQSGGWRAKLARLCALSAIAKTAVCVDDAAQVEWIEQAAADSGRRMTVLVEIDVGAAPLRRAPRSRRGRTGEAHSWVKTSDLRGACRPIRAAHNTSARSRNGRP